MKILWVGTKPPWPPADGGRLVAAATIEALAAAGHRVSVIAPALGKADSARVPPGVDVELVAARLLALPVAVASAALGRTPVSIARHTLPPVRRAVARRLESDRFDAVHAEQVQALAQCAPAFARGLPVVLRAQNVESDLWRGSGSSRVRGMFARREGMRFARFEADAVRRATAAIALTEPDAARLESLAGGGVRVHVVPAPAPSHLPPAAHALSGHPPIVLLGGTGWLPNRRGALWFLAEAWGRVRSVLPGARLHVFGGGPGLPEAEGVERHPAPEDSRDAFPAGAVLVVPLDLASGVRMKILEAWARGVPVVATATAAAGLGVESGRELLIAAGADGFAAALRRLRDEPGLGPALTEAGRALLGRKHDPGAVAAALVAIYDEAAGTKKKS